jgi:hypothetical protein
MKISDATIKEAVRCVEGIIPGTGMTFRTEVQDEGEFVLFAVEMPPESPEARNKKRLMPFKKQLLRQISALIQPKEDGDYSWQVVFTVNHEVVDAVMADVPLE